MTSTTKRSQMTDRVQTSLEAIRSNPGILLSELAERVGIPANEEYRGRPRRSAKMKHLLSKLKEHGLSVQGDKINPTLRLPHTQTQAQCLVCGKPVEEERSTCSTECTRTAQSKHRNNRWRDEEIALIDRIKDQKYMSEIAKDVQALERKKGWPIRSHSSIRQKAKSRGFSPDVIVDRLSLADIARYLNVRVDTVEKWRKKHGLPCQRVNTRRYSISHKAFCEWAYQNELLLRGKNRDGIFFLTEDADFADRVSRLRGLTQPYSLQRVDTGEKFKSARAAARGSHLDANTILHRIQQGLKDFVVAGIPWRLL